jgi:hypothetical protein
MVNDESGNYLGKISDFVIDQANNRVSLVVLTAVPGFGAGLVSFPYQCLQRNSDKTFTIRFASEVVTGSDRTLTGDNSAREDAQSLKNEPNDQGRRKMGLL